MNWLEILTCLRFKILLNISSWGSASFIMWGWVAKPARLWFSRWGWNVVLCNFTSSTMKTTDFIIIIIISSMSQNSLSSFINNRICHWYCHCCPGFFQVFLSWDRKQNSTCIIKKLLYKRYPTVQSPLQNLSPELMSFPDTLLSVVNIYSYIHLNSTHSSPISPTLSTVLWQWVTALLCSYGDLEFTSRVPSHQECATWYYKP